MKEGNLVVMLVAMKVVWLADGSVASLENMTVGMTVDTTAAM